MVVQFHSLTSVRSLQLLGIDTDIFTCETDKALCCAKAYEVMEQYVRAARPIVEALVEHPRDTSLWYCLGHLRYIERRYEESVEAFEKVFTLMKIFITCHRCIPQELVTTYKTCMFFFS